MRWDETTRGLSTSPTTLYNRAITSQQEKQCGCNDATTTISFPIAAASAPSSAAASLSIPVTNRLCSLLTKCQPISHQPGERVSSSIVHLKKQWINRANAQHHEKKNTDSALGSRLVHCRFSHAKKKRKHKINSWTFPTRSTPCLVAPFFYDFCILKNLE